MPWRGHDVATASGHPWVAPQKNLPGRPIPGVSPLCVPSLLFPGRSSPVGLEAVKDGLEF